MGDSAKDQPFFLQAMVGLIGLKYGKILKLTGEAANADNDAASTFPAELAN
jgi:hypothetical protein